ncbi:MAG: hypothetical protein KDH15_13880 [Rhodocyclaceae bacterium]|nr:hypothetical protein [Rhodocyclaceae bacterium]
MAVPEMKESRGELVLTLIADAVSRRLQRRGMDKEQADEVGAECGEDVRTSLGGGVPVYIPNGKQSTGRIAERNAEIWKAFNGSNYEELARAYDLSVMMVRRIIAKVRREKQWRPA